MKKFVAVLLAFMLAFMSFGTAFAAGGPKSPSIEDLMYFIPAYSWTYMEPLPTMENIEFAREELTYFLGADYTIYEAFNLDVSFKYAIVKFVAPTVFSDGNYIFLMTNAEHTYFLTPILIDMDNGWEAAVMDFTNVETGVYQVYFVGAYEGV